MNGTDGGGRFIGGDGNDYIVSTPQLPSAKPVIISVDGGDGDDLITVHAVLGVAATATILGVAMSSLPNGWIFGA